MSPRSLHATALGVSALSLLVSAASFCVTLSLHQNLPMTRMAWSHDPSPEVVCLVPDARNQHLSSLYSRTQGATLVLEGHTIQVHPDGRIDAGGPLTDAETMHIRIWAHDVQAHCTATPSNA